MKPKPGNRDSRTQSSGRWAALLAAALTARAAPGQPDAPPGASGVEAGPAKRPTTAGRITRLFDFEESSSNPSPVPRFWVRAQDDPERTRVGFPPWNRAELSYVHEGGKAFTGDGSVRLPTAGGSTSILLEPGVAPVFVGADYLISARVRTEGLAQARARLVARLLDVEGHVIPGTEHPGELIQAETEWTETGVKVTVEPGNAAYVQIELCLLQPEQYRTAGLGKHQVWRQDVKGCAWFDDVAIVLLPRVELSTQSPINIIQSPEKPELRALVRDLTGESLGVVMEVYDARGERVGRMQREPGSGSSELTWAPPVERFGWYRAVMDMMGAKGRVGSTHVDFLWVAPVDTGATGMAAAANPERRRFGLVIDELDAAQAPRVPLLARLTGAGSVTVPIWGADLTQATAEDHARELMPAINGLLDGLCEVTLSLPRTPASLAHECGLDRNASPLMALASDPRHWMPYLGAMMDKYGQRVGRWELGGSGDDAAFWRRSLESDVRAASRALSSLVSGPVIVLPGAIDRAWGTRLGADRETRMALDVPPWMLPEASGSAVRAWRAQGRAAGELTLVFESRRIDEYGSWGGVPWLVEHAVEAWAAGGEDPPRLALRQPWSDAEGRSSVLNPAPELAAWRSLANRLSDRRVSGVFPAGEGVTCYVLSSRTPGKPGALVLWRSTPGVGPTELRAYLGDDPLHLVDLFGNSTPVEAERATNPRSRPMARVPIGDAPVFVEGVDTELVRFLAEFTIDPSFLDSKGDRQTCNIVLTNPWAMPISGTVTIVEPGGFESAQTQRDRNWKISPRVVPFSLPAGATQKFPFAVAFSPVEEAGVKPFVARLELTADHSYGVQEIRRTIVVGNRGVPVELTARVAGKDVIVEASITNGGEQPLNLRLTAFAPGRPRIKSTADELMPGKQVTRRFAFPGGAEGLHGQSVLVSIEDPDSGVRINKSVQVE